MTVPASECQHEKEYQYFGGIYGYYHCLTCRRWWQADLNGYRSSEHMKEVDGPYRRDLLTDFIAPLQESER